MEDLVNIIKEIKSYKDKLGLNCSDDIILDCSVRIFNSQNINYRPKKELATEPQLKLLEKFKVDYPNDISKKEADRIIKSQIGNK